MKNKANYVLKGRKNVKKPPVFLRHLSILFLTAVCSFCLHAKAFSQTVTISKDAASIRDIFREIYKQTKRQFVYTDKVLEGAKPIDIHVRNVSPDQALDICFKNQPFTFVLSGNAIIIQRKEEKYTEPVSSKNAWSPGRDIRGRVTDSSGKPVFGGSVLIKGTKRGTTTNSAGEFSLSGVDDNSILVFSCVGYIIQEVAVKGKAQIDIVLQSFDNSLNTVFVNVGYGRQKKEFLTASVSTVSGAELVKAPVPNLSTALKGQLAGLVALQTSGKPGSDGSTLTIRGIGTYTGQTAPLIMVDGVARDTYDDIDMNEVESVSILKDASATAVYGVRGANGVILIITKRGKEGPPAISVTTQTAQSSFTNLKPFANSYQYATLMNEQAMEEYWVKHANDADIKTWDDFIEKRSANWRTDGSLSFTDNDLTYFQNAHTPKLANGQANPWYDPYFHPDTDWKDKLFKKSTPTTQLNANITGGTRSMKYFVSLGYLNQGGLFKTDYMTYADKMEFTKSRYNLRGNFDFDVSQDFKIAVNVGTQFVTIGGMDNDQYVWEKKILWSFPMSSPGMINGKYVLPLAANGDDHYNPMYALESEDYWNITNNSILNSSVNANYKLDKLVKGLSVHALGSYDSYFASRSYGRFIPLLYDIRPNPSGDLLNPIFSQRNEASPPSIFADFYYGKWRKIYSEASINYDRYFGQHTISAMVLGSREKKYDPLLQYDLPHAYEGLTARANYNFAGKYIVEYDMGYNGSENFPVGKRFGYFPSYSGAWLLSKESFFPVNKMLNFVKLKGSYGEVGNDNIRPAGSTVDARYLYLPDTWKPDGGYTFGTLNSQQHINGADESVLGNPDVTWEVSKEMNLSLELHLFASKLSVIYEYYKNNRSNILSYRGTVPGIVAANLPPYNLGSVKSWGHDLELTYRDHIGDFNFYLRGNAAIQKNKILFQDEAILRGLEYQAATGHPVGQQLMLKADGLYTSWSQLYQTDNNGNPILSEPKLALKNGKPYTNAQGNTVFVKDLGYGGRPLQPGDVRLVDVNGDGVIDTKDQVRMGKTINPEYNFGLTVGFNYKGFDFSVLFAGIAGVARGGMGEYHFNHEQAIYAVDLNRYSTDRFSKGQQIDFPMADYDQNASGFGATNAGNSFFLINTSYVRLQNLSIGYTISRNFMKKMGVRSARIFVSGDNLYTWSAAKLWGDPENLGNIAYPLYKTYNTGVNISF
jgi:TonB-linked SusC/RagA family outer membrane protein